MMVSRSQGNLEAAKKQVEASSSQVKVLYEVVDLSELSTYTSYSERFAFTKKYDIAILINNAGVGCSGKFEELTPS